GDQLFWARVPANTSVTLPVPLPAPALLAADSVRVEVMLCGAIARPLPCPIPEHTAEIYLNRRRILRASWSGARPFIVQSPRHQIGPIPASVLAEADSSTITVANIFDCPQAGDRLPSFYVNWVRIEYPRLYVATNDELWFCTPPGSPPGVYTFVLEGFQTPNVLLFRAGISRILNYGLERVRLPWGAVRYTIRFQTYVASPEELFYAIAVDSVAGPMRIVRDLPSRLSHPDNAADYMIITHKGLWDRRQPQANSPDHPVQRLLRLRQQQGLRTTVVDVDDIYDEFNDGIASRDAIHRFLRFAWSQWRVAPRYVVLVGNATAIPPQLWQTRRWGMTPTDYTYGCVEGTYQTPTGALTDDPIPEMAVGRIPAESLAELEAVVAKLWEMEEGHTTTYFQPRTLLVAGINGFIQQTELLATRLPLGLSQRRLYVQPGTPYTGHTAELLQLFADGAAVVNFLGHGGGGIWEDAGLLRDEDVELFSNRGRYPVVSSLTCFTGAFEQQAGRRGLLSSLVIAPGRGATAAWGNSGYGWLENSFLLSLALLEAFTVPTGRLQRLGDAFRAGKALYAARAYGLQNEIVLSMLLQATLIGDPAQLLQLPTDTVELQLSRTAATAGEMVTVTASLPFSSGTARVLLADEHGNDLPGSEQVISLNGPQLSFSVTVPANYTGTRLSIRLYAVESNRQRAVMGGARVSTGAAILGEIQTSPSPPVVGQPLALRIPIRSRTAIQSVTATVNIIFPDGTASSLGPMPCQLVGAEMYQTEPPIPAALIRAGAEIRAVFTVLLSTGQSVSSPMALFSVPGIADPAVVQPLAGDSLRTATPWLRCVPTAQGAYLQVRLYNWRETPAGNVLARLWRSIPNGPPQLLAEQRVNIPGNGSTDWLLRLPRALQKAYLLCEVISDSLSTGGDRLASNNRAGDSLLLGCFALLPPVGTTDNGVQHSPVGIEGIATVAVFPAQAPAATALLWIETLPSTRTVQPNVHLVSLADSSAAVAVTVSSPTTVLAILRLWYLPQDTALAHGLPAIYRKHSRLDLWERLPTQQIGPGVVQASVVLPGIFAVATSSDRRPPQVRITAEGRALPARTVLSANPRISIVGVDENGVSTDTSTIRLTLNGQPVPVQQLSIVDSAQTPTATSISYRPQLQSGTHILCATLADCNGNPSERTCIQMEVSTQLDLRLLGTYPNPFREEMFIAYELLGTSSVDEVELRLYTASGRCIRRMVFPTTSPAEAFGFLRGGTGIPTMPGYHEIWWDGMDDEGRPVANGIYFYRLRVRSGDTTVERRGSVARVR
ncbi:MAG: C25 family cysteine peptidase, partial [Chlorobiota bacterium]